MDHIASLAGNDCQSRRLFMEMSAKLSLGVSLSVPFLPKNIKAQEGASAKSLIYIYLSGGMTHLDTFDPKRGDVMGNSEAIDSPVDNMKFGSLLPGLASRDQFDDLHQWSSRTGPIHHAHRLREACHHRAPDGGSVG